MTSKQEASHNADLSSYVHIPFEDPSRQIRLIHLLGGETAPIKIKLTAVDYLDCVGLTYEALSYAWGDESNAETVIVEGKACGKLQIRANLHLALHALRLKSESRCLWIDAISINQTDLAERGKQILLMHRIYKSATQVIAWIGPKTADSDDALDCMDIVNSHVSIDPHRMGFIDLSHDDRWANTSEMLPFTRNQITAICNLLHRPWFERLWIWPEIRVGSKHAKIRCGDREMLWANLATVIIYLGMKPIPPCDVTTRLLSRLGQMSFLCAVPELNFFDALHRSRWCKCSDDRDRIFTGLILDEGGTELDIQPNYEDSVCDLYTKTIMAFLDSYDSLEFLKHAEGSTRLPDLPSWVPDWSTEQPAYRLEPAYTSTMSLSCARSIDSRTLSAKGLILSEVAKVVPFRVTDHGYIAGDLLDAELADHIREVAQGIDLSEDVEPLRALCRVFAQNRFSETQTEPDRLPFARVTSDQPNQTFSTRAKKENYLRTILGLEPMASSIEEFREIRRSLRLSYTERSTYLSSDGKYGVAPLDTQAGDLVVAFLGCGLPFVLRRRGDSTFQFIGEAYLDGSMHGEAFLGPLPQHFSLVRYFRRGTKVFNFTFRDERTGHISTCDPRQPDLPPEWEFVPDEHDEAIQRFRNKQTGVIRSNWTDPRCTAEAFEERGLALHEFHLR